MPDKHHAGSTLQARLAGRILTHAREQGFGPGAWLSENALAQAFGVSRTPVRGALASLSKRGLLNAVPRRGYLLKRAVRDQDIEPYTAYADHDEDLTSRMAADRVAGMLPDHVVESDLMRRYDVARGALTRMLHRLAEDGVLERRNGQGWRFVPALNSARLHSESYRFRLLVEPASMLEPTFRLDKSRAQALRAAHVALLGGALKQLTCARFFDLNCDFHEFLAACSGNRYLYQAVVQQNRLRRFFGYVWKYEHAQMRVWCSEHVAILDRLIAGDREHTATLLWRHLHGSSRAQSTFAQ